MGTARDHTASPNSPSRRIATAPVASAASARGGGAVRATAPLRPSVPACNGAAPASSPSAIAAIHPFVTARASSASRRNQRAIGLLA